MDTKDFWLKLEAERLDQSYKRPPQRYAPTEITRVIYKTKPQGYTKAQLEKRERLFFNAGRFAAGARDKNAVKANQWLNDQLDGKLE